MTPHFHNPDIAHATTIPASWYTDPAMLELEQERLFRRSWQFASSLEALRLPGNFIAVDIVGVPVVVVRDGGGSLRAFYNICRHRAGRLARGAGNRKTLQCCYHGWVYNLDGSLRRAPEFDGVEDFDGRDFGLIPVRVDTWGPFVFINLDNDAAPLSEWMGEITAEVEGLGLETMRRVERRDYHIDANWKLYVDNYLEGYHLPVAHPGLFRELDYENYRVETFRYHSRQHAPIRPVRGEDESGRHYVAMEGDDQARYYWLFPNFMLNIYLGMLQINIIIPLSYDRTLTIFEWYYTESSGGESWNTLQDSMIFSDEIQREDIEICEDVWRNLKVGVYEKGRYSVKRENGVHHFHGLLAERVGEN